MEVGLRSWQKAPGLGIASSFPKREDRDRTMPRNAKRKAFPMTFNDSERVPKVQSLNLL